MQCKAKKASHRILLVEDSRFFGALIKREIETILGFDVFWAETYAQAEALVDCYNAEFFAGLLDLNLPDAPMGKIVDLVISRGIPSVVFTGELSDEVRDHIWSKGVADYVLKQGKEDVRYVLSVLRRFQRNADTKILIVDDSSVARKQVKKLLAVQRYQILEAANGRKALEVLARHPDIRLVVTDYYMPQMDGFELTKEIRSIHPRENMAVIGISSQGNPLLSAKFIKNGANDFIVKPFISEEFYCRIDQNVEIIEYIDTIRKMSYTDFLTGLYNRRYFYETGQKFFAGATRGHYTLALAVFDIDDFKQVNDRYGHEAGDLVLKEISQVLRSRFREGDVVARFGGEEFCVLVTGADPERVHVPFEKARKRIETTPVLLGKKAVHVTTSIGVCTQQLFSLDEMIAQADQLLYEAKQKGKNRVICS